MVFRMSTISIQLCNILLTRTLHRTSRAVEKNTVDQITCMAVSWINCSNTTIVKQTPKLPCLTTQSSNHAILENSRIYDGIELK